MGIISVESDYSKLVSIESKIDTLIANSQSSSGITLTPLTLSPVFSSSSSNGTWSGQAPANSSKLYDGDANTATDWFWVSGIFNQIGKLNVFPGTSLPGLTRAIAKIGIQNNSNGRGIYFIAATNILNTETNHWAIWGQYNNTSEVILLIDLYIPYQWQSLIFGVADIGAGEPKMRVYDLSVWGVS